MSRRSFADRRARFAARLIRRTPSLVLRRRFGAPPTVDGYRLELRTHAFGSVVRDRVRRDRPAEVTVDVVRRGLDTLVYLGSAEPPSGVSVHDRTIPGPAGEIDVRTYRPAQSAGERPAVVWFHQGGCVLGGLDTDHTLCAEIASRAGAVVVSIDYRKGPENPFPADVVDALVAYEWVVDNAAGLGIDPARVAVGGTSGGGRLAAAISIERRIDGLAPPAATLLLFPSVDQHVDPDAGSGGSMAHAWPLDRRALEMFRVNSHVAGVVPPLDGSSRDHRVSPTRAASLAGFPPSVVVTAGFDPLRDQGNAFAEALTAAGIEVVARCETNLAHSFSLMGGVSRAAARATRRFADDCATLLGVS